MSIVLWYVYHGKQHVCIFVPGISIVFGDSSDSTYQRSGSMCNPWPSAGRCADSPRSPCARARGGVAAQQTDVPLPAHQVWTCGDFGKNFTGNPRIHTDSTKEELVGGWATPLKYLSIGMIIPIGKIKNVPNHQPGNYLNSQWIHIDSYGLMMIADEKMDQWR